MHLCVSPLTPLHMHPSLIRHRSDLIHASMRGCISVYSHPTKLFRPVCVVQLTARDIPEKYSIFGWEVIILVFLSSLSFILIFFSGARRRHSERDRDASSSEEGHVQLRLRLNASSAWKW